MIHFELIFVFGARLRSRLVVRLRSPIAAVQFVEKAILPLLNCFRSFLKHPLGVAVGAYPWASSRPRSPVCGVCSSARATRAPGLRLPRES